MKKYVCYIKVECRDNWFQYSSALIVKDNEDRDAIFKRETEKIKREGHAMYPVTHVVFYPIQDILP